MTARTRSGASRTGKSRLVVFGERFGNFYRLCIRLAAPSLAALLLGGCTVGPKYVRPPADVPPQYKETGNWMPAQPNDEISKGQWWQIYGDPQLNALEEQVTVSNETLKAAQAQFLEARAAVRVARAPFFPVVTGGASVSRATRVSQNKPSLHDGPETTMTFNCRSTPPTSRTSGVGSAAPLKQLVPKRRPPLPIWPAQT